MILTKLCRNDMNPYFFQERAYWRWKFSPHLQLTGILVRVQP